MYLPNCPECTERDVNIFASKRAFQKDSRPGCTSPFVLDVKRAASTNLLIFVAHKPVDQRKGSREDSGQHLRGRSF
jgi:hypothetical protein